MNLNLSMDKKSVPGPITSCQICSKRKLETILSLGHQPPTQAYVTREGLKNPEPRYPLHLCRCSNCGLLQLDYAVDPKILFPPSYPYRTGITNMLVRNFEELAETVIPRYHVKKEDLIIDIGSNDGTLLKSFQKRGARVLGIEPTNAARTANRNGVPTIEDYFTRNCAHDILKKHGRAKVVTATNVFAHMINPLGALSGIAALLSRDGVFISESQYVMDILEKLEFDTIYHEHLRFYSLETLQNLLSRGGFSVVDAERISAAGGSIRAYAQLGKRPMSQRALELLREERRKGLNRKKVFQEFADKTGEAKLNLLNLLVKLRREGKRIIGLGAPARANPLLNYMHIDTDVVEYLAERKDSPKIGLMSPGTHIPIREEEKIFRDKPDYILVLSWHIGKELMKKIRERGYRGSFILPLPLPRIMRNI